MPIDVSQIESFATITIGTIPEAPLYEGDSFETTFIVAEGFESDGTPINPALFSTEDGGWGAEIEIESPSTLPITVDTPLLDDGQVTLRIALNGSTGLTGKHRGNVRIFNPIAGRTQQRVLFNFVVNITAAP